MNFAFKNHKNFILMFFLIILISCKLQEPSKNHGILFLENRAEKLSVSKSNKNDVFKINGAPPRHFASTSTILWTKKTQHFDFSPIS